VRDVRRFLVAVALLVGACGRGGAAAEPAPVFTTEDASKFCVEAIQHYLDWELDDPDAYSRTTENRAWARCEDLIDGPPPD
jgi:hypothetical protein